MHYYFVLFIFFFFQAEDGIRDKLVTGVQTCALPICSSACATRTRPTTHTRRTSGKPCGSRARSRRRSAPTTESGAASRRSPPRRSEEHTSELQSLAYLVCRLLLEKKKTRTTPIDPTTTSSRYKPSR